MVLNQTILYTNVIKYTNLLYVNQNQLSNLASISFLKANCRGITCRPTGVSKRCQFFSNSSKLQNLFKLLESMPKINTAALELRKSRLKAKAEAKNKPQIPPSFVYLTAVGNGAVGNPRSLFVFTDHKKYLFNCGEGTQRLAYEHKVRLSKIEHIFFTHRSWHNLGGFPGLTLTMQELGVPDITLHGPPDIERLYPMTQHFKTTRALHMNFRQQNDVPFEDNCFRVTPVRLLSNIPLNWTYYKEDNVLLPEYNDNNDPKRRRLGPSNNEDISVAYICKLFPKPGQLQLEKCVDLGVPCGPLLGELKNGQDVTLKSGKIVRAADVVSPSEPGLVFIVVECPNEGFLDPLLEADAFRVHQTSPDLREDEQAAVIAHFTPASILETEKYQQWIKRFSTKTEHLYLNNEDVTKSFVGVHRLQHQLHLLEPNVFPLLPNPIVEQNSTPEQTNSTCTETMTRYSLRPTIGYDETSCVSIEPNHYVKEVEKLMGFKSKLEEFHTELRALPQNDVEHPNVLFLGTGSAIPSKVRNVSGILVEISPSSCMLMDCGEGTYGQLIRFHGIEKTAQILLKLKIAFISHEHADHHMGLMEILLRREEVFRQFQKEIEPVRIIIPKLYIRYLVTYHNTFQPVQHLFSIFNSHHLETIEGFITSTEKDVLLKDTGLKDISTVFVNHCKSAYGLTFTTDSDEKIVYSGDTMPCERLVNAGKGCHLLIHEATMEDDLITDAELKFHSTTSQAIEIGKKMDAKFTILTHFSQRYTKVPIFNENFNKSVGIAFDNMRVRLTDLPKLSLMIPVLKCMFQESYEFMEDRQIKRRNREDILASYSKK